MSPWFDAATPPLRDGLYQVEAADALKWMARWAERDGKRAWPADEREGTAVELEGCPPLAPARGAA